MTVIKFTFKKNENSQTNINTIPSKLINVHSITTSKRVFVIGNLF